MDGMVKPVTIIVQAHMGSSRLKNKMMKQLCGETIISHIISRLKNVSNAAGIVVATSDLPADDILAAECNRQNVYVCRGSDSDVLNRFFEAAKETKAGHIARVCADNPLLDWNIIHDEIELYRNGMYDMVACGNSVPLGLGCEIFSFAMLRQAEKLASEDYQREHVTPYMYEHCTNVFRYETAHDAGRYRFTMDTEEDYALLVKIYEVLYHGQHDFALQKIVKTMEANPEWRELNKHIRQKLVGK